MSNASSSDSASRRMEMRIDSDPAALAPVRKAVETFAIQSGLSENDAYDVGLCLNEALANVMRHAYSGRTDRPIVVSAEFEADTLSVSVRDWGNGIDPSTLFHPTYNPHEPGGVGLICLSALLDRMIYSPQPDGMLATLVKRRRAG